MVEGKLTDKRNETLDVFEMLLSNGADFSLLTKEPVKEDPDEVTNNIQNNFGFGKRFYSHKTKKRKNTKKKKDGTIVPDHVGSNLVHLIANHVHDCVDWHKFLIEQGKINLNTKREDGRTELLLFMKSYPHLEKDKSEVFEYLISQGADINAKDKEGNSPIFYTCFVHNNYYRDKLLQLNCELDVLNEAGTTPLITIVKERNLKVVERLIEHGAKINFHDSKNRNVLHWAVNNATQGSDASNELENFLLSSGADPTALDINKRVPLHYAFVKIGKPFINSSTDPIETVSNILSREAARKSINVQDNWGNTPLHYAS